MRSKRRDFLKKAAGATAAVAIGPAWMGASAVAAAAAPAPDAPSTPRLAPLRGGSLRPALELDGSDVGLPFRTMGGEGFISVLEFVSGDEPNLPRKSCGSLSFEDITVEMGLNMEPAMYEWIDMTFQGLGPRHDGAIVGFDSAFEARARREFSEALISEVSFPALDAASKDAARMTVKISPESTQLMASSGAIHVGAATKQKAWLVSNFKVAVGNLPCNRISKIEALSFKQKIEVFREGGERFSHKIPGRLEFPNLVLSLAAADAGKWRDWYDEFVIGGACGPENEMDGQIEFLDPALKVLGTLQLHNLGIVRLTDDPWEAGGDGVGRITVEMYVESMRLLVGNH